MYLTQVGQNRIVPNCQHHMKHSPFLLHEPNVEVITRNDNRLTSALLQTFNMLKMSVSMLTAVGVLALSTSAAHMVQNKSSGAESYTLEVQSNSVKLD